MSDNCETSAAENSRCELCGQLAPNVDLWLDARGNGSALKALICSDCALDLELRMDEDTAGDSVQSDYTETGDSVQREQTELEPAAWLVEKVDPAWSDNVQSTELVEKFTYVPAHERGDKEPLVRLSAVEEWYADILYQLSFLSNQMPDGAQEYLQRKRRELREFTQGGPSE